VLNLDSRVKSEHRRSYGATDGVYREADPADQRGAH
jgi:hypothetical protein